MKLYGTGTCGFCKRVKYMLKKADVGFEYHEIDIYDKNFAHRDFPILVDDDGKEYDGKDAMNYAIRLRRRKNTG